MKCLKMQMLCDSTCRYKNYYILLYSLIIKYITVLVMVLSNKRATKM